MSKNLRIGIVGAGIVSENYHVPVLNEIEQVEIIWVCDVDIVKAKKLAREYKLPKYNDDINKLDEADIVLLAIPVGSRSYYYDYFSDKKTSLFIEKPLCQNIMEYKKILDFSKNNNNHVGVGLMRRSYHSTHEISKLFESMLYGPVKKITASEGGNLRGLNFDSNFYQNKTELSGGGALIETGSHLIDQIFTIFKINNFNIIGTKISSNSGIDIDTKINSIIFSDLQSEEIELNLRISKIQDLPNNILIEFNELKTSIGLMPDSPIYILDKNYNEIAKLKMENNFQFAKEIYQAFYIEWNNFIEQVINNKTGSFCISTKSSFLTVKLIEQVYKKSI